MPKSVQFIKHLGFLQSDSNLDRRGFVSLFKVESCNLQIRPENVFPNFKKLRVAAAESYIISDGATPHVAFNGKHSHGWKGL